MTETPATRTATIRRILSEHGRLSTDATTLDESADFNSVNLSTNLGDELDRIERLRGGPADGK